MDLDGALGAEIAGTRPAVVVSQDWLNTRVRTALIVPLTRTRRRWLWRVDTTFKRTPGQAATDQARAQDLSRFRSRLGRLDATEFDAVLIKMREMFTP